MNSETNSDANDILFVQKRNAMFELFAARVYAKDKSTLASQLSHIDRVSLQNVWAVAYECGRLYGNVK